MIVLILILIVNVSCYRGTDEHPLLYNESTKTIYCDSLYKIKSIEYYSPCNDHRSLKYLNDNFILFSYKLDTIPDLNFELTTCDSLMIEVGIIKKDVITYGAGFNYTFYISNNEKEGIKLIKYNL